MDIRCVVCGEPWDIDELHDVRGLSFEQARQSFSRFGCEVFNTSHNPEGDEDAADFSAALFDILGDDIDAIASELEDFGF